jgi:hypothetical protein
MRCACGGVRGGATSGESGGVATRRQRGAMAIVWKANTRWTLERLSGFWACLCGMGFNALSKIWPFVTGLFQAVFGL